jgi:hypothetical protein
MLNRVLLKGERMRTLKQKICTLIGTSILVVLFIAYVIGCVLSIGWKMTCIVHSLGVAILFAILFALYLINKGTPDNETLDLRKWNYDLKNDK